MSTAKKVRTASTKPAEPITKHFAALAAIDFIGEKFFDEFQVERDPGDAAGTTARLSPFPPGPTFSLRGSPLRVVANAIAAMEADAKNRLAMVRELKRQLGRGLIPTSPVEGFVVVRDSDGETVSSVFSTFQEANRTCDWGKASVHAVLKDGSTHLFCGDMHEFVRPLDDDETDEAGSAGESVPAAASR